jgi:hypothetical protein
MIQKAYSGILDPIVENVNEGAGPADEMVDYDNSGESSQTSDVPYLTQGQGVLALAAPSLRHERTAVVIPIDGSQLEPDTQEEPLSQVDNPPTDNESPGDGNTMIAGGGVQQPAPRMSSRLESLGVHNTRIDTRTRENTEARNIPGTNLNTHNSFSLLDDDDVMSRDLEMGVRPDYFSLEKINYLKDLEIARHAIVEVQDNPAPPDATDISQVLLLGFGTDQSGTALEDADGFTPVMSRRKKRERKSACKIRRGGSRSKSGDATVGAQSKSCAALVKANSDHPLIGIVAGTRRRKKP